MMPESTHATCRVVCANCRKQWVLDADRQVLSGPEAELFGQRPTLREEIARGAIRCPECDGQIALVLARPEILLHPVIPPPLHGVAPRDIMGESWWSGVRHAAQRATDCHCAACWVPKQQALVRPWLEGHELYKIDWAAGRMEYQETVALCHLCHNFIHRARLRALLDTRQIQLTFFQQVLDHGEHVLAQAALIGDLAKSLPPPTCAAWQDWRLVFDGNEYPPKFKTQQEWEAAYT